MTVLGLVAAALASAVSAGMAVVATAMLAVRTLQAGSSPAVGAAASSPDMSFYYLIVLGTLAGLLVAGAITWVLLAPVGSTYRQGGLAVVSAFATFLGMLVCAPVYSRYGKPGLASLLALCVAMAIGFALWARRVTASLGAGSASATAT